MVSKEEELIINGNPEVPGPQGTIEVEYLTPEAQAVQDAADQKEVEDAFVKKETEKILQDAKDGKISWSEYETKVKEINPETLTQQLETAARNVRNKILKRGMEVRAMENNNKIKRNPFMLLQKLIGAQADGEALLEYVAFVEQEKKFYLQEAARIKRLIVEGKAVQTATLETKNIEKR